MKRGVLLGTGAGLLWGLAFVLPGFAPGWSAIAVTAGRYLAYGVVSCVVLVVLARRGPAVAAALRGHWRPALLFAATGNVGYYLLLVVAIQAAGAPVVTAVIGSVPVVMAAVANLRERTYAWRQLAWPLLLVGVGLTVVTGPQVMSPTDGSPVLAVLGVVAGLGAVALWTSYGISNATFLRNHPAMGGSTWSAIVGVFTGLLAVALVPIAWLLGPFTGAGGPAAGDLQRLVVVAILLGVAVSWGGTWLWNEASSRLSTTLAGLLIVTETISGYTYAYILDARLPPATELLGFILVIAGVVLVTRLRTSEPSDRVLARLRNVSEGGVAGRHRHR